MTDKILLDLLKVEEMFNRNLHLLTCLASVDIDVIESLLNIPQDMPFKILLATIGTLKTWYVIHNKKFAIVPVNVLCLHRFEILMTTENTPCMHHEPRSYGFLNFGGVGI